MAKSSDPAWRRLAKAHCPSTTAAARCFMAILDMCHFLVDQFITHRHNFADIEESSMLRSTNTRACALLTAECYSYWYSAPAGPGIFEMLCDWTKRSKDFAVFGGGGGGARPPRFVAALHALAVNECAQWPRRRKTGTFFYAGDDNIGAALLADESLEGVYEWSAWGRPSATCCASRAAGASPMWAPCCD